MGFDTKLNERASGRSLRSVPIHTRCFLLALAAALPSVIVAFLLLGPLTMPFNQKWTIGLIMISAWLGFAWRIRGEISNPLLLLSGTLRSLAAGDYSIRLVKPARNDFIADIVASINVIADLVGSQRLRATETALLLDAITDELDAAMFTLDNEQHITFINRAGERLIDRSRVTTLGKSAEVLGLASFLDRAMAGDAWNGAKKRWDVKRKKFYSEGRQHTLIVVSDLTAPLRQEERLAWQRLIRVLGHEINNSLTPIRSLSSHLIGLVEESSSSADAQADLKAGLALVVSRSEALKRFTSGFARVTNVPPPRKTNVEVRHLLERLASLETRVEVEVKRGPSVVIQADSDQIEQAIINLLKNAADAAVQTHGRVEMSWRVEAGRLRLSIRDEGPGISDSQNLFVPFYTTKSGGSGIGLVLSRQIVEAHGGALALQNRTDRTGCEVVLELPLK